MKRTLFVLMVLTTTLVSCDNSKTSAPHDVKDPTERQDASQQRFPKSEVDLMTVEFSVECANLEIGDLLKERTLKHWSSNFALGGTIHKDDFFPATQEDTAAGVMMWYNIDKFKGKDRVVMAFEQSNIANIRLVTPHTSDLKYPENVFSFDFNKPFRIEKHANAVAYKVKEPLDEMKVVQRMKKFDDLIADTHNHSTHGRKFNETNGAFFQNNPEPGSTNKRGLLSRLVHQTGADSIRYYFAFRDDPSYQNMIRIILVAVDKNGENIVPARKTNALVEDGLIVQKSVPPGPEALIVCP